MPNACTYTHYVPNVRAISLVHWVSLFWYFSYKVSLGISTYHLGLPVPLVALPAKNTSLLHSLNHSEGHLQTNRQYSLSGAEHHPGWNCFLKKVRLVIMSRYNNKATSKSRYQIGLLMRLLAGNSTHIDYVRLFRTCHLVPLKTSYKFTSVHAILLHHYFEKKGSYELLPSSPSICREPSVT